MNFTFNEASFASTYQYGLGKMVTAPAADDFLRELMGIVGFSHLGYLRDLVSRDGFD